MDELLKKSLNESEEYKVRMAKLSFLSQNPYQVTKSDRTNYNKTITENFENFNDKLVTLSGRLTSKRGMGKIIFGDIIDQTGKIQLYISRGKFSEQEYVEIKKLDVGDILEVEGTVFKTQRGEISVRVQRLVLLSKSLRPLPEKYHGLQDADLRYRKRYLDLIANPEVKNTFLLRSQIIRKIREFLDSRDFLEVDTPILNTIPGGAAARPFITHHNTLNIDMYLRIAPELYLKRLIVGGFEKVYEMGRLFRNEGMSAKHNPEFTSVEVYEAYRDYEYIMNLTEELIKTLVIDLLKTTEIEYSGKIIHFGDINHHWNRISMLDAVKEFASMDFSAISSDEEAQELARKHKMPVSKTDTWGKLLNDAFEMFCEEYLWEPTFITDYPVEVSPLAKRKNKDPRLTERFELFITNKEIANGFSELNDPIDQRNRFLEQVKERESGNEEANMMDDDFVEALEYGLPPTAGLGIGVDRLIMLLTNKDTIRDILLFPTMKPIGQSQSVEEC